MNLLNKRELEILHLLTNCKEYQTGGSIAALVGVSPRTIRNDVKKLNGILMNYGANIVSKKGLGYEIEIKNESAFKQLYSGESKSNDHLMNHSQILSDESSIKDLIIGKLLMNALTDRSTYQEELANELYISLSSFKSYLPAVKSSMSQFDLEIVTDRFNGIKVSGEEDKLRFCISELLFNNQSFQVYNDLFPRHEIERLKEITLKVLSKHKLKLTDVGLESFIIHIEITLRRHMKEQILKYSNEHMEALKRTKEFIVAQEIIDEIHVALNINIFMEIYYITQHLVTSSRLSNTLTDSSECKKIEEMLKIIMGAIEEKTSIDLSMEHALIEGLIIHLSVALKRIEFNMNIRNVVLSTIKNNYPLAFELAVIASNEIKKSMNLDVNENETGFLAIHFGVALEKKGLNKRAMKKIMIVCGSGMATVSLIRERISNYYGEQVSIIESTSLADFNEMRLDKVDMVLSTVPIPHVVSDKIMIISPVLSDNDLSMISSRISSEEHDPVFISYRDIFKKDLFKRNIELNTKEEVLQYLTCLMEKKGYIDQHTKRSIYEREKMASTELGHLVAIPHPLENNMSDISIAVCILKKPIIWEKEKVQVAILLSVPKDKQKIWEIIFKKLYHFLIEDFGITKLVCEYSYEDFIRNLVKYKEKTHG